MYRILLLIAIALIASFANLRANMTENIAHTNVEILSDSLRLVELDRFWAELSRTVSEGDFEAYAAAYHDDAVVVFATRENKVSVPISEALANWKQGFSDTKAGKTQDNVTVRFSQRIGSETTAHETGIFFFTSRDRDGKILAEQRVHFEMLLVKHENRWLSLMEYQKSIATEQEWGSLE